LTGLPTGTVTFLFTDIEGSTTLLQRFGDHRYAGVLAEHQRLLRDAFAKGNGHEVDTQGDAFLVAFPRARDALAAAVAAQRSLMKHLWPDGASLRVRMGLHTGEPVSGTRGYVGLDVHRAARICSAGHGGQILLSHAVEVLATRDLPSGVSLRDLGTHRLKDLRESEHLLQVVHPDLPWDFPPLRSLDVLPNNLPVHLTSFVGREHEKVEVRGLLATARLLTLTGSGGAGKTRLALAVAAEVVDDFADGVWLVELAPLSDPTLVPKAVASVLSVPEQPGRSLSDTLVDFLRSKTLILVLDNCEHLLTACSTLVDLLIRASRTLRILATSREGLGITGEMTYRVPSLSLPDLRQPGDPEHLLQYEAVRLFAERAALSKPAFTITRANARAVAEVCHRLDGIPLAIELAAARLNILSVEQILARLADRFRLLTGGSRTALPRQQTLRAVMDWSYGLLGEPERAVLRRLSVFAGGFTLEAAEAICGNDGVGAGNILDLIAHLADKSLIIVDDQDGGMRYRLLETVRQYGRDRLLEEDDAAAVRTRHRNVFLTLAEEAEPRLFGADEATLVEQLETEHDNLRAALAWSLESGDADPGLRLSAALGTFWHRNGHWTEGREWLTRTLEAGVGGGRGPKAKAFSAAANLAWAQGDLTLARTLGHQALALRRQLDDKHGIAGALRSLGSTSLFSGDTTQAMIHLEESLRLSREIGDRYGVASALRVMGWVAITRRTYPEAARCADEIMVLYRAVGFERGIAYALEILGLVASAEREDARAAALLEDCVEIYRTVKDRDGVAMGQALLGHVIRVAGDHRRAVRLFRECIRANKEMGNRRVIFPLEELALISASRGDSERAARLFGAVEGQRKAGSIAPTGPSTFYEGLAAVRATLGEAQFAAASAEGRAMTREQVIECALGVRASFRPIVD
jgi:predicted ATPase/class 3 adenylate cyclase